MLFKHPDLPDWPDLAAYNAHQQNRPEVHDIYRRWRTLADSYRRELTLVGEVHVPTVDDLAAYLRPDELPQAFYFDLLSCGWAAPAFRASITRGLDQIAGAGAVITWTLANHDVHRAVSRYGLVERDPAAMVIPTRQRGRVDTALGEARARAAVVLLLALPGSVYLYQGEELGLPEVMDLADDLRQDPTWSRSRHAEHGRDGCRIPLPWHADRPHFGFSAGSAWLPQPAWFARYAAHSQWDTPGSTLLLHAQALRVRREMRPQSADDLTWLDVPGRDDVLAFRRGTITCVTVFGDTEFTPPAAWGQPVCVSAPLHGGALIGPASAWLLA
jgi:alpha-glucosidase